MAREFYVRRVVSGGPESWGPHSNLNDAMEKSCELLKFMVPPRSSPSKMIWASSSWVAVKYELDASSWASHNQSSPLPKRQVSNSARGSPMIAIVNALLAMIRSL